MNIPPVFSLLSGESAITDIVGTSPTRIYLFGTAPQNAPQPYVTWALPVSTPENHLSELPVVDQDRVQIDVWAQSPVVCIQLCGLIRDALEPHAHMIMRMNMGIDPDTNLHRWTMDFTFWTGR